MSPRSRAPSTFALLPGLLLAGAVAATAKAIDFALAATFGRSVVPAMVAALVVGVGLSALAAAPRFAPGLDWCIRSLLRIAIGLLGVRVALLDIAALGPGVAFIVMGAMAATMALGIALSLRLGAGEGYGALAGAATAVCGASATLAMAAVVPNYPAKAADVAFAVIAANAVSTLAMIVYPPLAALFGLDARSSGVLLGATIHDMAQVVGAAYAVSDAVGNAAVIVKLFRVALLLPVVLAVGWWFARRTGAAGRASVSAPRFAVAFLALALVNSAAPLLPARWQAIYADVKGLLVHGSNLGLLLAISALGLGTSLAAIARIGWRQLAAFAATTLLLFVVVAASLVALR